MAVNLKPAKPLPQLAGVMLACVTANLRYQGRDDLVLIQLSENTRTSAVFTQNAFAAAPVEVAKTHMALASPRALLINMGNANAATGEQGVQDALQCCQRAASLSGLLTEEVLPFSTGVIGEPLPMPVMNRAIKQAVSNSGQGDWLACASAIMTTDTVAKAGSRTVLIDGQAITINGIAKGAGMMCPNMATMLAFVATDAPIAQSLLTHLLKDGVAASFNRITVDSDTSTNDAVTLSATGQVEMLELVKLQDPRTREFAVALESLLVELATSIVRDAEGATKFIFVQACTAASTEDAQKVVSAVANSPLVKTALFASDPNWGRLPMAIGKSGALVIEADKVGILVNGLPILKQGVKAPDYSEAKGQAAFAQSKILIRHCPLPDQNLSVTIPNNSYSHFQFRQRH